MTKKTPLPPINAAKTKERVKPLHVLSEHKHHSRAENLISRMKFFKADGYFRETMFGHEVIWNWHKFTFPRRDLTEDKKQESKESQKKLFIFALVKKDALRFIKKKKLVELPPLSANVENIDFERGRRTVIAVDINDAYWQIAYRLGLICENTYDHGTSIDDKRLCLAALASLGKDIAYRVVRKGEITGELVIIKGNAKLKIAYNNIRNTCYSYMQEIAHRLGADFMNYKTDCIYFIDTKKNRAIVTDYLESKSLDCKFLFPKGAKF